jgi:hypothetical protein
MAAPDDVAVGGALAQGGSQADVNEFGRGAHDAPPQAMYTICQLNSEDGVRRMKALFHSGLAHPRCQRGDGNSPLHLAAASAGSSEVRKSDGHQVTEPAC